ncbi:MAG: hypothetical protein V3R60_05245 [Acidobacteriota bacterium]
MADTKEGKPKFIRWDATGTVARLTLNRPSQNVMNLEMMIEMATDIEEFSTRHDVWLFVIFSACK